MKANLPKKKIMLLTLAMILCVATVYAAYYVWTWTTHITVIEPFSVTSDIPDVLTGVYPGTYNYTIWVTNNGGINYGAQLIYWVTTENATCVIEPANETVVQVPAGETVSIPISLTIVLGPYPSGSVDIDWAIERVVP